MPDLPHTADQRSVLRFVQRRLVEAGYHPAWAGRVVRAALERVLLPLEAGVGKVQQARRVRRELMPGFRARPTIPGERCRRVQEIPGRESEIYQEVNRLREQGWNVMEVPGGGQAPRLRTFYACPPGQLPEEAQTQVLEAEPWGAPLLVREGF